MGEKLIIDILGQKFGHLLAVRRTDKRSHRQVVWECLCDCGNTVFADCYSLRSGHTTSCGCVKSKGEEEVGLWLKKHGYNYKQQYSFRDLKGPNNGLLKFDFAVLDANDKLDLLIEFQGIQHYMPTSRNGFGDMQRCITDKYKEVYCKSHSIPLYTIKYNDDVNARMTEIMCVHDNPVGKDESV